MEKELRRFACRSDDGTEYTVVEWVKLVRFQPLSGSVEYHNGPTDLRLADGSDVTPHEPGSFKIYETDEIIRKVTD